MKSVYLLRHAEAERGAAGELTLQGQEHARSVGQRLPHFAKVIASSVSRAKQTALLLTGIQPEVDERASFYMPPQAQGEAASQLAVAKGITFLEAIVAHNDQQVLGGMTAKAKELNNLIDETLSSLGENEQALIVSHDMTIPSAMALRGESEGGSISNLAGYIIGDDGRVTRFSSATE